MSGYFVLLKIIYLYVFNDVHIYYLTFLTQIMAKGNVNLYLNICYTS